MDKNIMVVHVDKLFGEYPRKSGFYTPEFKFENVILENFEYMKRKLAEENVNYKQPLPYAILRTQDDRLFVYQRGDENSQVGENRLYGKVSFGVGGHVEEDVKKSKNPLLETLLREIQEEVGINPSQIEKINLIGYINDDTNDVGKVHLGVAYIVDLKTDDVKIDKRELASGRFVNIQEAKKILSDPNIEVESWSKILLQVILN